MRLVSDLKIRAAHDDHFVIPSIHKHKAVEKCSMLKNQAGRLLEKWGLSARRYLLRASKNLLTTIVNLPKVLP